MKKDLLDNPPTLGETITAEIRRKLVDGELAPGQRLSEAALSESLKISRNTLREAFRMLAHEGLLKHEPNRGVFVSVPDMGSIIDIYRARRFVECQALSQAYPKHPAVARMRECVASAVRCSEVSDWAGVGTSNMGFHAAIVELADSPRLNTFYAHLSAELRLVFGLLNDPEFIHAPYVDMNTAILQRLQEGRPAEAAAALDAYLVQSERTVLAAYARRGV